MRALLGLVLCGGLMFATCSSAYARGGTYHRAEFVPLSSVMATRKPAQALDEAEKESSEWGKLTGEALVYRALARDRDSKAALAGLIAKHDTHSAYQIAQVYAYRGEPD